MMSPVVTIGLSISVLMVIGESAHPVVEQKNNKQILGKEISVYVETIGDHSKEYLVDLDHLLNYFGDRGYEVLENTSFNKLLNTYKGPPLSTAEKKFTGMYNAVVLRKN